MSDSPRLDLAASQQAAEETWVAESLAGPTRTRLATLPPGRQQAPDLECLTPADGDDISPSSGQTGPSTSYSCASSAVAVWLTAGSSWNRPGFR